MLNDEFEKSKKDSTSKVREFMESTWSEFIRQPLEAMLQPVDTTYPVNQLKDIAKVVSSVPEGVKFLRKAEKILRQRGVMVFEKNELDWGMAETLAYGSLMEEGYDVRISGQ